MFEDRSYKRTFYSAPQSVESLIAAFLEPGIIVLCFLAVNAYFEEPVLRSTLTLCLLVFALTFPGRNRFGDHPVSAIIDVLSSWVVLLIILALCGYATNSLGYFEDEVLLWWAVLTPVAQSIAVEAGRRLQRWRATLPDARRTAVIVGAGPLGAKVARALREGQSTGIDFLGYFDDRQDDRLHPETTVHLLGMLSELSDYVRAKGVREVYITLPLGSQPRIVQLLEQIQGTTASLFFVPDVFGISIIQGRLQDMNGVPVVGICETPFTGTNELVKRISDVVLSQPDPGADLAAAAGHGHRCQAQFARARSSSSSAATASTARKSSSTSSARCAPRTTAAWSSRPPRAIRASPPSAPSSAAPRWTSCRSSSMCCRAA